MKDIIRKSINGDVLVYKDKSHRYYLNDKPTVSVTTFIKAGLPTGEGLINYRIKEAGKYIIKTIREKSIAKDEAIITESYNKWKIDTKKHAEIGTAVHDYAHLIALNKPDKAKELLDKLKSRKDWIRMQQGINNFVAWNESNKDKIVKLEEIVASPKKLFAGRFDRLAKRGKDLVLTDYKTSKAFYPEQFIQNGAYAIALKDFDDLNVTIYEVVRFSKETGNHHVMTISGKTDLQRFKDQALRCLDTYNFMKIWKKGANDEK